MVAEVMAPTDPEPTRQPRKPTKPRRKADPRVVEALPTTSAPGAPDLAGAAPPPPDDAPSPAPATPRSIADMSVEEIAAEIERRKATQLRAAQEVGVAPEAMFSPPGPPQVAGTMAAALAKYNQSAPMQAQARTALAPDPDLLHDMPPPSMVDPEQAFRALSQGPPLNPYQAAQVSLPPLSPPTPNLDENGDLVAPSGLSPTRPQPPAVIADPHLPNEWVWVELPGGMRGRVRRDAIEIDKAATPIPTDPGQANYRCMIGGTDTPSGHPDFYADPRLAEHGVYIQCPQCGTKTVKPLF